jgi:hypothetical protein
VIRDADAEPPAQGVQGLLPLIAAAVGDAERGRHAGLRDADGFEARGHHVAQAGGPAVPPNYGGTDSRATAATTQRFRVYVAVHDSENQIDRFHLERADLSEPVDSSRRVFKQLHATIDQRKPIAGIEVSRRNNVRHKRELPYLVKRVWRYKFG